MNVYKSVLTSQGGGSSEKPAECVLKDGMISDLSSYRTADLSKSLVEGELYILSFKATNENDPEGNTVFGQNNYPFVYNGSAMTLSFRCSKGANTVDVEIRVTENQLEAKRYTGSWQYIWAKLYLSPIPSGTSY